MTVEMCHKEDGGVFQHLEGSGGHRGCPVLESLGVGNIILESSYVYTHL